MLNYTITKNNTYNSLEISFTDKPSAEVREALKSLRFRWNGKRGIWYGYATEEATRAAIEGKDAEEWKDIEGATTAPHGYKWQSNGKSRFSGEYKNRLVKKDEPKAKKRTTQNHIRIYWNGIKIDGGKLIRCLYIANPDSVTICERDYKDLPRDLFEVKNDSDSYTDYFETDRATVGKDHPLFKYFYYAALKEQARDSERYIEGYLKKRLALTKEPFSGAFKFYKDELKKHEAQVKLFKAQTDPGQPTAEDLAEIDRQRTEKENERKAQEHREELKRREVYLIQRSRHHQITETARQYPIEDGAPVVTIRWSEHPAFIWADEELRLSVKAAEKVLSALDAEEHERGAGFGGYFKTSFRIDWTDETGEACSYEGRYDLGDGDGGMVAHIRSIGEWELKHDLYGNKKESPEETNDRIRFADYLAELVA